MKIQLGGGNSHSSLSVSPKNWKTKKASIAKDWFILYRFYDSRFPKPKQIMLKGMNSFKNLQERQIETQKLLEKELAALKDGFNPFDKNTIVPIEEQQITLIQALKLALEKVSVAEVTKKDIKTSMDKFEIAITQLDWIQLSISDVSRKHIRQILDKSSNTDDRFNKNRSYLMILISVLCELELVAFNFVRDIKKRKVVKYLRQVLTDEERVKVNEYLLNEYPEFHRFLHIFFHSGARISELIRLKVSDVDLANQRFKMVIKKGTTYREVWKTIKTIALPFWIELINDSNESDFVFSKGLKPGAIEIQPYQINKRWYRLVKKKLNIKADFYSLKHLHTTEVVELIGAKEAAIHNGHNSTSMVSKVYDVRREIREQVGIASLKNKFA
jgi:integrase